MSKEFVGGLLVVAALSAVLYHGIKRDESRPMPAPVPISNPAPVPEPPHPDVSKACTVDHPCHVVKPEGDPKKPVYHKVLKGGQLDGPVDCKYVPAVAHVYPKETVIAYAKARGLTPAQLSELRLCLN